MSSNAAGSGTHVIDIAAYLAPFPLALIEYSLTNRYQQGMSKLPPISSPMQAEQKMWAIWNDYLLEVRTARQELMEQMDPLVEMDKLRGPHQKKLNHTWIAERLAQLAPLKKERQALSAYTIGTYVGAGILKKGGEGVYDPETILTTCILRAADQNRERNWIPLEKIPEREEGWYCWSQEYPGAPVVPCPYPNLPINLPRSTLLYTRFACASWNNKAWLRHGYRGAITFSGLIWDQRAGTSHMTLEDLEVWEPGIRKRMHREVQAGVVDVAGDEYKEIDMSLGLSTVLRALEEYRYNGILHAEVYIPGEKGRCSIQLVAGQVTSTTITTGSERRQVGIDVIKRADGRRGPFEWVFQPERLAPLDDFDPGDVPLREYVTTVLKHLGIRLFSASNIHKV